MTPLRRLAGVLLLACTVLGLASMHTLGHHSTAHPEALSAASIAADPEHLAQRPLLEVPCHGGCHEAAATPGHTPRHTSLWEICVAVFAGSLVLLLLRSTSATTRGTAITARALRCCLPLPRPPPSPPVGLKITTLSVLRT